MLRSLTLTPSAHRDESAGLGLPDRSWVPAALPWTSNSDEPHVTAIGHILEHLVAAGVTPGATAAVAQRVDGVWRCVVGSAGTLDPFGRDRVGSATWYDLASITKSVTALGMARAVDQGMLEWDAPLDRYLPSLAGTFSAGASLSHLLSHRAGLAAHVVVDIENEGWLRAVADSKRPDVTHTPGRAPASHSPLYSDLGYILLGEVLRVATERDLDEWLGCVSPSRHSCELLSARQMERRGIRIHDIAPTEVVASRGGLVRGQVHDDNAWAIGETNTCGHAGLFGTAGGVAALGMLLLDLVAGRSDALSPSSVATLLTPRPDGSLRAGFDGKNAEGPSSIGRVLGPRTFGHLGFTGTSYWCDPDTDTVVALLTNRVCPSRANRLLRAARPHVHDDLANLARSLATKA